MDDQNELYRLVELFSALYGSRAKKVADRVLELLEEGLTPSKALAIAIQEIPLFSSLEKDIGDKMAEGAALGFGTPQVPEKVKRKLLDTYWTSEKMNLSKRLHGATKEMRQNIVGSISASMRKQETFVATARKLYDGYNSGKKVIQKAELPAYLNNLQQAARRAMNNKEDLAKYRRLISQTKAKVNRLASDGAPNKALKASYQQLVKAAEELNKKALRKVVKVAIEEKSRYHAERIARTEIARAYAEGFIAKVKDDEEVIGIRWRLGSRHPKYDICDFYAKTNLYGMGVGVFPKDRLPPFPAHPHCLCRLSKVYKWEAEVGKEVQKRAGDDFLKSIPETQAKELLGYEGYSKWTRGADWQDHLRGWQGQDEFVGRLEKEDFGDSVSERFGGLSKLFGNKKEEVILNTEAKSIIRKIEAEISKSEVEIGVIFDHKGKEILRKVGEAHQIEFTKAELKEMKGRIFLHNHPYSTPPSPEDLYLLKNTKASQFRITGESGTYIIEYDEAMKKLPKFSALDAKYEKMYESNEQEYIDRITRKEITPRKAEIAIQEGIWDTLKEIYGLTYYFEKRD